MPTISRAIWRCIGKSSELLLVVDSEQLNGWQQLHDSYLNGYPDRNAMGFIEPKRIQVKLLKPDLALALIWWSVSFPSSKQKVVGNSTMNFHTPQLHFVAFVATRLGAHQSNRRLPLGHIAEV
jgi:hypothetical protein